MTLLVGFLRFFWRAEHAARRAAHPALLRDAEERTQRFQDRIADGVTAFAGSMVFVYIHMAWFVAWVVFKPFGDGFPFGLLTMLVSLEAIFLSTFIMISQNRADIRRQLIADEEWRLVQAEEVENAQIIQLTQQIFAMTEQIHRLTVEVHSTVRGSGGGDTSPAEQPG